MLARNEGYWGGAPKADTLRIRIIPEPLTQAAEYEAGQLSVVEVPVGETRRWEQSHASELQRRPALTRPLCSHQHDPRAAQGRPRSAGLSTTPWTCRTLLGHSHGRPRSARRGLPSARVFWATTPPGRPTAMIPPRPGSCWPRRDTPTASAIKLWRTQRAELARLAQSMQQNLAEVGIRAEIVERDASSARAAVRNGEADLFLTDWWADYPDPENFNFPLFHSRNKGPGGNYAFLADAALDSMILRARGTTDETEKARLVSRDRRPGVRAGALDLSLVSGGRMGQPARRQRLAGSAGLHRAALDRGRA